MMSLKLPLHFTKFVSLLFVYSWRNKLCYMSRFSRFILVAALLMSSFLTSTWNRHRTQHCSMSFASLLTVIMSPSLAIHWLTRAPIRDEKTIFVSAASSTTSCFNILVSGFIVVSHSCAGIISPKPADAEERNITK